MIDITNNCNDMINFTYCAPHLTHAKLLHTIYIMFKSIDRLCICRPTRTTYGRHNLLRVSMFDTKNL